jgi:hypothetical protein
VRLPSEVSPEVSPDPSSLKYTSATGDTTRPGIRDGVLLSESSGTLHFDFYSMIATGSDQLVQLTHRLAI